MCGGPLLTDWPEHLLRCLRNKKPCLLYRVEQALCQGIIGHTDFSGKRCAESSLNMLVRALDSSRASCGPGLQWHRSSDIDPTCCELSLEGRSGPRHVFGELLGRLPLEHRNALKRLRPLETDSKAAKEAAFLQQWDYLQTHLRQCFPGEAQCLRSECRRTGQLCPVAHRSEKAQRERELTMVVGGSMCTPWSSFGSRTGLASEHTESMQLYFAEIQASQYDLATLENSPLFPRDLYETRLGPQFHVARLCFGPEDLGWPVRRKRLLQTAIFLPRWIWVGPQSEKEIREEFQTLFFRATTAGGDVFLTHSKLEQGELKAQLGLKRGLKLDPASCWDVDVEKLLPPQARESLHGYRALWQDTPSSERGPSCIVDLSQSLQRKRMDSEIPTLMTTTLLYSLTQNRFFTVSDLDASQGFPTPSQSSWAKYQDCLAYDLEAYARLPLAHRSRMSGNGMHLCAMAAWHLYVLSNIVRRDSMLTSPRAGPSVRSEKERRAEENVQAWASYRPVLKAQKIDAMMKRIASFEYEAA